MQQYLDLLRYIRDFGVEKSDRTGTGTKSVFGYQMRFNLTNGFPLVTTKKTYLRGIVYELLWFLQGSTNVGFLQDHDVHIWDEWADQDGELGPVYGSQWRSWPCPNGTTVDQIAKVVDSILTKPDSRRHIVSAWNVGELEDMALMPCHAFFQFYVNEGKLSCQLYQRSADAFLGVPFNISSYSLLTCMMAQVCGLKPGEFVWTGGDCHLYLNHLEQAKEQISRKPLPLPKLKLDETISEIDEFTAESIEILNYQHHPHISAPISV